jgi:hypothetical protein
VEIQQKIAVIEAALANQRRDQDLKSPLSIVTLYSTYTRALTFENYFPGRPRLCIELIRYLNSEFKFKFEFNITVRPCTEQIRF